MLRRLRNRPWEVLVALFLSGASTILSTYLGARRASATYPDIMGCEVSCEVAATGWPLIFVRDYTGMSVVNRADFGEVLFAADRLDWPAFLLNLLVWWTVWLVLLSWTPGAAGAEARHEELG